MLLSTERELVDEFDLGLVDLDGVAYRGSEPIDHASACLTGARDAGMSLVFITNNASREPESVAAQLTGLGIVTEPDEVMTAAQAAAAVLVDLLPPGAAVLVIGGAGLLTATRAAGFTVVTSADQDPDAVVQGFAPELGWRHLAEAAYAVQAGALHVVSNRDMTLPTERGMAPGNGSLVRTVMAATGVEPVSAGKPEPTMFHLAVERRGAKRPLVVGDRLDTDLGGARAAGYPGLHVLTGVSSARDAVLAAPQERPSYLGLDLRSLHRAHPAVEPSDDGWWRCRDGAARIRDGRLELGAGSPASADVALDTVRAACGAAWAAVDDGIHLDPSGVPDFVVVEDR